MGADAIDGLYRRGARRMVLPWGDRVGVCLGVARIDEKEEAMTLVQDDNGAATIHVKQGWIFGIALVMVSWAFGWGWWAASQSSQVDDIKRRVTTVPRDLDRITSVSWDLPYLLLTCARRVKVDPPPVSRPTRVAVIRGIGGHPLGLSSIGVDHPNVELFSFCIRVKSNSSAVR